MRRRSGWVLLVFLVLATVVPGAQAALMKSYSFEVDVPLLAFGKNESQQDLGLTLLTGRFEASGERLGLFGFVGTRSGLITDASRVDVYNTKDQSGAVGRAVRGQCNDPKSCSVEATYMAPTISLSSNSTFILYSEHTAFKYAATAPFLLMTMAKPPSDIGGGAIQNLTVEQSLLLVGEGVAASGHAANETTVIYAYLANANSTLTISGPNMTEPRNYTGGNYVFRLYGLPQFAVTAKGMLLPFVTECRATLTPAAGAVLRDQFRPETIGEVLKEFGSNESVNVPDEFRQVAPILNGVLVGGAQNPVVNAKARDSVKLALIRFGSVDLVPAPSGAHATGHSPFVLLGNGFYTTSTGFMMGPLGVPALSVVLWVLAAGAIAAGFFLKPLVAPEETGGGFGTIRLIGWAFHGLALVLAFILWDAEIRQFLGTSLLVLITSGGLDQGAVLALTAVFELVPFGAALLLLGMPIRFIVNSGLKLGGLKKARGIGKGVGNLAAWGLGASFIPFFLNGVVGAIVDALGKALP